MIAGAVAFTRKGYLLIHGCLAIFTDFSRGKSHLSWHREVRQEVLVIHEHCKSQAEWCYNHAFHKQQHALSFGRDKNQSRETGYELLGGINNNLKYLHSLQP